MKTIKNRWFYPVRILLKFSKSGTAIEFKRYNRKAAKLEALQAADKLAEIIINGTGTDEPIGIFNAAAEK